MIQQRDFWIFVVLNILTCGLYSLFFWYVWNEDVNRICEGDGQDVPNYIIVIILGILTCGIYTYYWMYKQGNRLQANAMRYGVRMQENGSSLLLWALLGYLTCALTIYYSYYLMVRMVNQIAPEYNARIGYGNGQGYGQNQNYGSNQGYGQNYGTNPGYGQNQSYESGQRFDNGQSFDRYGSGKGRIICLSGPEPQRVTEITDAQTLVLGQDGSVCNHIIMGFAVEAKHCSITYRKFDDMYLVTDHSVRGTYKAADDTRLKGEEMTELPAGSVIYLGDRRTMYRLG